MQVKRILFVSCLLSALGLHAQAPAAPAAQTPTAPPTPAAPPTPGAPASPRARSLRLRLWRGFP
jgi:hypothetical protein